MPDLRYPIGKFTFKEPLTEEEKEKCLYDVDHAPANLRAAVSGPLPVLGFGSHLAALPVHGHGQPAEEAG